MKKLNLFESILNTFYEAIQNKINLVSKNPNLSDDEKQNIKTFLEKHPSYESKFTFDWKSKKWNYNDFQKDVQSFNVFDYLDPKDSDYVDGKDYKFMGEKDGLAYYVSLNHEAQRDLFQQTCPDRWCVGKHLDLWKDYTQEHGDAIFLVVVNKKHKNDPICIEILGNRTLKIWDQQDKSFEMDTDKFLKKLENKTFDFSKADYSKNGDPKEEEKYKAGIAKIEKEDIPYLNKYFKNLDYDIVNEVIKSRSNFYKQLLKNNKTSRELLKIDYNFFDNLSFKLVPLKELRHKIDEELSIFSYNYDGSGLDNFGLIVEISPNNKRAGVFISDRDKNGNLFTVDSNNKKMDPNKCLKRTVSNIIDVIEDHNFEDLKDTHGKFLEDLKSNIDNNKYVTKVGDIESIKFGINLYFNDDGSINQEIVFDTTTYPNSPIENNIHYTHDLEKSKQTLPLKYLDFTEISDIVRQIFESFFYAIL